MRARPIPGTVNVDDAAVTEYRLRLSMAEAASAGELLAAEVEALRHEVASLRLEVEELRAREAMYRECVENVNSIVLRWDPEGRITFLNEYGQRFFGYEAADVLGCSVLDVIVPATETGGRNLVELIDDILQHPERYRSNENENVRRDGERVWITWRNRPIVDAHGRLREILSTGIDTTERKRAEERLRANEERFRQLALEDTLTGLYNRRYLYEVLERLIAASVAPDAGFSLIFMDLDDFKLVVDTHGHLNGSRVIQEVAATIREAVSAPGFGVAYGGDEFIIVLPRCTKVQAIDRAEYLRARVNETAYLASQGVSVHISASLGVATYPDDASDLESVIALADHALYGIKRRGKNAVATGLSGPVVAASRSEPARS
jgi:two-component system, cell cycle response regulator